VKTKFSMRDLSPALWPALVELFGPRGACGGCWCMYWRLEKGERWDDLKGAPARRRFRKLVESGEAMGAIAFAGDEPVGWIAYGPRTSFPRLDRARTLGCPDSGEVWALPCFFIKAGCGTGASRRRCSPTRSSRCVAVARRSLKATR
jgi:hypothetical protein